ncbi:phytoene/squalene synthase family protein [Planctomicrobium sp. SH661]|uniref:phytoene/squalene synthase family protein n=1 Tax=Planctomicrobium sp. SH661 TaxID=3448124 RepID=UPI003F5B7304
MSSSHENSYRFCEQLARRSGSNFFVAFRTLPREMFRQMCVLYAFMRCTDDLGDRTDIPLEERQQLLNTWKGELRSALAGQATSNPVLAALVHVSQVRQIPEQYLAEVIDGVSGDLTPRAFEHFHELEHYCYQVAGVVGLCCVQIWGYPGDPPTASSIACGTAFQLTNILRDLKEDSLQGRVYLPQSELRNAGLTVEDLQLGRICPAFRDLMQFQVERAWSFYREAAPLESQLSAPGRRIFLAFFDIYSSLLKEIERAKFDVFSERIHLSRFKKGCVALRCLLRMNCPSPLEMLKSRAPARHERLHGQTVLAGDENSQRLLRDG